MTTAWLLLLLIVSSQSVDSQSTVDDDQVCDEKHSSDMKEDVNEMKRDIQRILSLLNNQQSTEMTRDVQRILQLLDDQQQRLGKW